MIARDIVVSVRVTEQEYKLLEDLAVKYAPTRGKHPNVSAYVRKCLFERPEVFRDRKREMAALRLEIRKVKVMLNRITTAADIDDRGLEDLRKLEASFSVMMEELKGVGEGGNNDNR